MEQSYERVNVSSWALSYLRFLKFDKENVIKILLRSCCIGSKFHIIEVINLQIIHLWSFGACHAVILA